MEVVEKKGGLARFHESGVPDEVKLLAANVTSKAFRYKFQFSDRAVLFTRNNIPLPARTFKFPFSDRSVITPTGELRPAWTVVTSGKP